MNNRHKLRLWGRLRDGLAADTAGQVAPSAVVIVMLLMVLAGVLVDGLHILTVRHRAYRIAADAALQGVREGTDYWHFIHHGVIRLKGPEAHNRAASVVSEEGAFWGLDDYDVDIRVIPDAGGGSISGFPPHPNAQQQGGTTWQADRPGVGVYIAAHVPTWFLGWFNGNTPITVHAFSASLVERDDEWPPDWPP